MYVHYGTIENVKRTQQQADTRKEITMKRKTMNETGDVVKCLELELKYKHRFRNGYADVVKKAELSSGYAGNGLTLRNVFDFQKNVESIFRQVKKIVDENPDDRFTLTLTIHAYENVDKHTDGNGFLSSLNQILFDCWTFEGDGYEAGEGFYLQPDEKYTSADRAVYISLLKEDGNLLKQHAGQEWTCVG